MTAIEELMASGPPVDDAELDAAMRALTRKADKQQLVDVAWTTVDAPWGPLTVATTERGLVLVAFGEADPVLDYLAERLSPACWRCRPDSTTPGASSTSTSPAAAAGSSSLSTGRCRRASG